MSGDLFARAPAAAPALPPGWVRWNIKAEQLRPGDQVMTADGPRAVSRVEFDGQAVLVWAERLRLPLGFGEIVEAIIPTPPPGRGPR